MSKAKKAKKSQRIDIPVFDSLDARLDFDLANATPEFRAKLKIQVDEDRALSDVRKEQYRNMALSMRAEHLMALSERMSEVTDLDPFLKHVLQLRTYAAAMDGLSDAEKQQLLAATGPATP